LGWTEHMKSILEKILPLGVTLVFLTWWVGMRFNLEINGMLIVFTLSVLLIFAFYQLSLAIDIRDTLRRIEAKFPEGTANPNPKDREKNENETSGAGALAGMVAGGALGLPAGPVGVVVGGVVGAIIGDELERQNRKKKSKR